MRKPVLIQLYKLPLDFFSLPSDAERLAAIEACTVKAEARAASQRELPPMTFFEQLQVILYCSLLATPLLMIGAVACCLLFGYWRSLGIVAVVSITLMLQPLPHQPSTRRGQIGILLCRYFAIEFCVDRESPGVPLSGIGGTRALNTLLAAADAGQTDVVGVDETPGQQQAMTDPSSSSSSSSSSRVVIGGPMINMACPHGVMNFGAVVFCYFSRWLVGSDQVTAVAGAVQVTPGLRQFAAPIWPVGASREELSALLQRKKVIGIIPDGINGIFARKSDGSAGGDAVVVGPKRGLMRLALEHGALVMAAYFVGTLGVYTVWQDRWGVLRYLSLIHI